jgi:hypothetical protein
MCALHRPVLTVCLGTGTVKNVTDVDRDRGTSLTPPTPRWRPAYRRDQSSRSSAHARAIEPDDRNPDVISVARDGERIPASPSDSRASGGPEKVRYSVREWPQNAFPYITTLALACLYASDRRTFLRP